jgi:cellulose synthase/poly-beta-1,6-N-acetylglucosamine synthase-like glycosyltransferase
VILDHSQPLPPTDFISVVVPAFNEERNVPKICEAVRIALAGERFEMIFVDDGSSNGTAQRVRELRAAALAEGKTIPSSTLIVVAVTFLGAVQLVSVGILGEYIGRIYEQTRGTPRYVVVERDRPPVAEAPPGPAKESGRPV